MVEIKFKEGTQFNRTPLVKYLFERCNISSLKEANEMVKSGHLTIPDLEYDNAIKTIVEHGGYVITDDGIRLLPNTIDSAQVSMLVTKSKKKNVPAIRIVPSEYEGGLAIESVIPVDNYVFQTLSNHPSIWHSVIDQMPFVCGITQFQNGGEDEHYSLLAARIQVNHNTVDEITSLSKVVHDVHTEIISTIYRFRNLAKKFNSFIDDVEVETRLDNSN